MLFSTILAALSTFICIASALPKPQFPYADQGAPLVQINFYLDQECTQWLNSFNISNYYDGGDCIQYSIPNAGSMNIANYWGPSYNSIECYWFVDTDCTPQQDGFMAQYGPSSPNVVDGQNTPVNCVKTGETFQEPQSLKCSDI